MATWVSESKLEGVIERDEILSLVLQGLKESGRNLSNIAIVSTDISRRMGRAGEITEDLYKVYGTKIADIFLALGSHKMHTPEQNTAMFGSVPHSLIRGHNWKDTIRIDVIPDDHVKRVSGGESSKWHEAIPIEIDKYFYDKLVNNKYPVVISIGPVFPHEVSGFSNGVKNILVGLGGKGFVDKSHYLGATYGMERIMGRLKTPVREVFDYVNKLYLEKFGIVYVLTVLDNEQNVRGVFVGDGVDTHEKAAELSRKLNVEPFILDKPLYHVVVNCQSYHALWVANKAIYRSRMAMDGRLIVLAGGVESFSDDPNENQEIEELIRKYGYCGTDKIIKAVDNDPMLAENLSAAAHMIHGSTEGGFNVIYATDPGKMPQQKILDVEYGWMDINDAKAKYLSASLKPGFNTTSNGETFFYVKDPSNVLLSTKNRWKE